MSTAKIIRPRYDVVSMKSAMALNWSGWHLSQKMDGVWAVKELNGCVVTGETMKDGRFFAFDIPVAFGEDLRWQPWTRRSEALNQFFSSLPENLKWHRCATGNGAEFIEAVVARGGEGVVAKLWASPFGAAWQKVKRFQSFDCIVTEKAGSKQSVRLSLNGEDCGWCPAFGRNYDLLKRGDIVEIAAHGRHASGKFREARIVRARPDKEETK